MPGARERGRMPTRKEVEDWLRCLMVDVDWAYDLDSGKSDKYRWARSGLDGLQSGARGEPVSGGGLSDRTAASASEYKVADVRRAAWLVQDAMRCMARARHLLTLKEGRVPAEGPVTPGWIRKAEYERLLVKQAERKKRGVGFGDA